MISYLKSTNGRIHAVNESEEGCWINVVNPTEDEVNLLVGEYEVEPEFIRAAWTRKNPLVLRPRTA